MQEDHLIEDYYKGLNNPNILKEFINTTLYKNDQANLSLKPEAKIFLEMDKTNLTSVAYQINRIHSFLHVEHLLYCMHPSNLTLSSRTIYKMTVKYEYKHLWFTFSLVLQGQDTSKNLSQKGHKSPQRDLLA